MPTTLSLPKALTRGTPQDLDEVLVQHPVDLNRPMDGAWPLVTVARDGDAADRLAVLLRHGADPRQAPLALLNAVRNNDADSVTLLVQHGADPRYNGSEALEVAGEYGLDERFEQLLDLGASTADARGQRGQGLLIQARWARVLDAARKHDLDAYRTAWKRLDGAPLHPALNPLDLVTTLLDQGLDALAPTARATSIATLGTMLKHAMALEPVRTAVQNDLDPHRPPPNDGPSRTVFPLVLTAVMAGNTELVPVLLEGLDHGSKAWPDLLDLDLLVRVVAGREDASPQRWLALDTLLHQGETFHAIPDVHRDQVRDALWASVYRASQDRRPTVLNALLDVAQGWGLPFTAEDLTPVFLDAVVRPGSGCVKALARRVTTATFARGFVKAVQRHARGRNDLWNEGRDWPLTGTPVDGFDPPGPFPLDVLRAAVGVGQDLSTLDWLAERGAQWLPHEPLLRAAMGSPTNPAWGWLDRRLALERPVHERTVLERQAQATLDEVHGATPLPVRGRSRL